jgi:hypothetical protein
LRGGGNFRRPDGLPPDSGRHLQIESEEADYQSKSYYYQRNRDERFLPGEFSLFNTGGLAYCRLLKTKGPALPPANIKGPNASASI